MKKLFLAVGILSMVISCNSEGKTSTVTGDSSVVEIGFVKNGELEFVNTEDGSVLQKIDIEIADTPNKQARGLMDRSTMDEKVGMLFIFDDENIRKHTFYMKNTRIPLDIMYFDKDSVLINIAKNAQPGEDSELSPGGTVAAAKSESKFVVEINGGLADKWGLKDGETKITWNRN